MRKPLYFRTRTLLVILAGLIFAGWFIPPFFHARRYRRTLEAGLESKLGRPVKLGAVTFRLLPHPGFSVENVVVEEDPAFGTEPFARVDRVECDLRWRSLWGSHLDCARIVLDHPTVNLVRRPDGRWNVEDFLRQSSTGGNAGPVAAAKRSIPRPFTFEARDARVNFTLNSVKKPFILSGVRASLDFDPSHGAIRFNLAGTPLRTDLTLPSPGRVELSGEWKPGRDFKGPFHALLYTHNALLYGWAPLVTGRNPGLYGMVDANLQLQGSIRQVNLTGHVHLEQLHRWESLPPSSSMPVDFSLAL
ncbi:MAG TPA: AsmA family protein, partial [Terriglobia bacterium]|nr:AsmA family protein [Terriglobia bacterium]